MQKIYQKLFLISILIISIWKVTSAQESDKIMIIIIDGARYTETFGDQTKTYIPKMWELSEQGSRLTDFANDNYTYTSRAIPALWCGAWTNVQNIEYQGSSTQYAVLPTLFEYYRKQKNMPTNECYYILKYVSSLWLPSFDPDYGQTYWPTMHSVGNNDKDVATEAQKIMDNEHPHFLLVYLADVDHAGHSGIWSEYTNSIQTADSIVDVLWKKIQSDPFYKDSTTLIVTNDHGRHDNQHGGFQSHGCSCEGCRHIQFLALGPGIKKNYVSQTYHTIPDMAVTAASVLDVEPTKSTGNVIQEIFDLTSISDLLETKQRVDVSIQPNPTNKLTRICYNIAKAAYVKLSIYNIMGSQVATLVDEWQMQGEKVIEWKPETLFSEPLKPGIYLAEFRVNNQITTHKIVVSAE